MKYILIFISQFLIKIIEFKAMELNCEGNAFRVFAPTYQEFEDFARYIEKLEDENLSFAKVSVCCDSSV